MSCHPLKLSNSFPAPWGWQLLSQHELQDTERSIPCQVLQTQLSHFPLCLYVLTVLAFFLFLRLNKLLLFLSPLSSCFFTYLFFWLSFLPVLCKPSLDLIPLIANQWSNSFKQCLSLGRKLCDCFLVFPACSWCLFWMNEWMNKWMK